MLVVEKVIVIIFIIICMGTLYFVWIDVCVYVFFAFFFLSGMFILLYFFFFFWSSLMAYVGWDECVVVEL